jgi:hypothetical protein
MRPEFQPIWLRCAACKHEWDDWQPCHVPIDTWIAHVSTFHCPRCPADRATVMLRSQPPRTGDAPVSEPAGA